MNLPPGARRLRRFNIRRARNFGYRSGLNAALRFMAPTHVHFWRCPLSMNLKVVSLRPKDLCKPGSWPQLTSVFWRSGLSTHEPAARSAAFTPLQCPTR